MKTKLTSTVLTLMCVLGAFGQAVITWQDPGAIQPGTTYTVYGGTSPSITNSISSPAVAVVQPVGTNLTATVEAQSGQWYFVVRSWFQGVPSKTSNIHPIRFPSTPVGLTNVIGNATFVITNASIIIKVP